MNLENFMNYHLVKRGYLNLKEVSAEDFMNVLENFLLSHLPATEKELDICMLYHKYLLATPNKEQASEEMIHYLLSYLSVLQEKNIKWERQEKGTTPTWQYTDNGMFIESLNTSKDTNESQAFNFVLCTLLDLEQKREEGITR